MRLTPFPLFVRALFQDDDDADDDEASDERESGWQS